MASIDDILFYSGWTLRELVEEIQRLKEQLNNKEVEND